MSRLVSRILLSIFMFPLAGLFYLLVGVISEQMMRGMTFGPSYRTREMTVFLSGGALTWMAVAAYWFLLWRSAVNWNNRRVVGTFISAVAAVGIGFVGGFIASGAVDQESFGAFVGSVLTILLWLIATVFLWRETAAERAQRVTASSRSAITCPTCGYNLTGLAESRCPECGSKFTLDELLALQQPKVEVEIE